MSLPVVLLLPVVCLLCLAARFLSREERKPIFGVYHQRSRWFLLKYALYLAVYHAVRLSRIGSGRSRRGWSPADVDRPLPIAGDLKAFDGVFFAGSNREGFHFVIAADRCNNSVAGGYFYLVVPGEGVLRSTRLPDTILLDAVGDGFGGGGIHIAPAVRMKKWKLRFRGLMRSASDPTRRLRVRFDAEWTTSYDAFDCLEEAPAMARAVATEAWTPQFFAGMRRLADVDYQQMGSSRVECAVGSESLAFRCPTFRSHQRGSRRDLHHLHRSASFLIFLDSGLTAVVGVASHRSRLTSLETGYVQKTNGSVDAVQWCDFHLYQNGECGRPPRDHGFQFIAGGTTYVVRARVVAEQVHFLGWNWEAKVFTRFVRYVVNGVPGRGVSEFRYRHRGGRPAAFNDADPQWFQLLRPDYLYS